MNLEQFLRAQDFFNDLKDKAAQKEFHLGMLGKFPVPPQGADLHFGTVAYSVALLYSKGVELLQKLEKEGVVHPSTIERGSLITAMSSISDYFVARRNAFTRDEYEQLQRTCYSAKLLLDKEMPK
ncbi:MAG: hypothetical protein AABX13_02225 [Nanoarchaeota archaeon]